MCANPEPMLQRHKTKPQTLRLSSHTSLFWTLPEQLSILHHACEPTHPEPTSRDTLQISIRKFSSHTSLFWTLPEQITPRMCANPEPMLQRHTTKPQTLRFSSHTSLFWTLPEQLSILHHACVPTHPEDTPQNLRPQDFHLTHPSFELCRSSSPYCTTHVCQPWTNVPKIHHKTSDPKILISHIPVLNFAGTALHNTPRMWANPSWTNVPRHSTNFNPKIFISHIPVLNFAGTTRNRLHRACANPEPMLQRHTTKPQTLRFSSHTSLFWTLPEQLSILHHACVPTHPEDTPQNLRPQDFHLTHPSFELCQSSSPYYTTHVSQPILNQRPKTHYKLQIRTFSSHTSLFWTLPEQLAMLHHACEPTHPAPTSQDTA